MHDLPEDEKVCACGCRLERIGEESNEKLKVIPERYVVLRNVYPKYACPRCEGSEDEGPSVKIAPREPELIPRSIVTPGLLAHLMIQKFCDHLPFYRQEAILSRSGIEVTRRTMCSWAMKVGEAVIPLLNLLADAIREGPVIGADETTLQVLEEPGRDARSKSYMWVFLGGNEGRRAVLYQYRPTRSGTVAVEFVQGYQGAVQCDGFDGYDRLEKLSAIVLHGCMAHARRKFVAVATLANKSGKKKGQPTAAAEFLRLFQKLYRIEKVAREAAMTPDQRKDLRQREAVPVLEELKKLLLDTYPKTDPSGLLGKAIAYTVNQWERLRRYVDNGHVEIDNNAVERAIRPFVIGRNNWLFSGVPRGADASAAIYSLIETAKLNSLEPSRYLNVLFSRLPYASTLEDYEQLLPFAVNKPFLDTVVV